MQHTSQAATQAKSYLTTVFAHGAKAGRTSMLSVHCMRCMHCLHCLHYMRGFRSLGLLLLTLCTMLAPLTSAHATPQEVEFLRKVAEQYVLAQFQNQNNDMKVEVEAGNLDDRRNYGGKCEGYLTAELRGNEIRASSQVKITCTQPGNEYTLYVPVRVSILTPALVASRNLSRGSVITPQDLTKVYLNESTNLTTAVSDPNILVGSRLKREVKAGEQIRANSFCVVCKNDKVNIIARSNALSLKTSGMALDEGNINDSIRVRNLKSQKIISAVIIGPGQVEVLF